MTYDPVSERGVLCDFDLARIGCNNGLGATGQERTGSPPFMAFDLLQECYYFDGHSPHLYRHELESCIWALAYVLLCDAPTSSVEDWNTGNYEQCRIKKSSFLYTFEKHHALSTKHELWVTVGLPAVWWLYDALWVVEKMVGVKKNSNLNINISQE